ncbi:putative membrane protein YesL [Natronobacillus azotifigens]|uniref:DUF624 domain-containing protein n=1 Tax=Natronobacillus azotifigens TaxID=472978 RepID=A0A9J6RDB1_9BACI|nr:DUF624 domain-containing protein [Natronobacillus azotifigens]MCZ0703714.1 DUF624 domain-containing protein [Natronobacillus azotifigens]
MNSIFFRATEWITRLVQLNILWLAFSLSGFIVFTFFPATVAMFSTIRQWLRGETDKPIAKTYWSYFKKDFLKAHGYGIVISFLGLVAYAHLIFMANNSEAPMLFLHIPFYLFLLFTFLTILYLFPVYVHYKIGFFAVIKQAFSIMIIHPLQTLFMIIGIVVTVVVMQYIPGTMFFFGGSFIALLVMGTAYQVFLDIEKKKSTITE